MNLDALGNLKKGDKVIVDNYYNKQCLKEVTKVTRTQIVIGSGIYATRYNKVTGIARAGVSSRLKEIIITEER